MATTGKQPQHASTFAPLATAQLKEEQCHTI